ncbi:MAG: TIGR01906 family membrane protein [Micrococcaceae bacterium]
MTTPDPDRTTGENPAEGDDHRDQQPTEALTPEEQPTDSSAQQTADQTTETAGAEDFESGLDYGAFVDDESEATEATETPRFLQDSETETTPIARQTELAREGEPQQTEVIGDEDRHAQDTGLFADDDAQRTEVIGEHAEAPKHAESAHADTVPITDDEAQRTEVIGEHTAVQEPVAAEHRDAEHNYTVPLPDLSSEQDTKINPDPADPFTGAAAVPASGGMGHEDTDRRTRREAEARAMARDEALESPRTLSRVLQVLLAIFAPIVLLIAAVRLVASPVFLWLEYRRPGFPADDFGFSTADRTVYGSYGLDYLFNLSDSRYLSELTTADGSSALFTSEEVSHMHDVKVVMLITLLAGIVLGLACLVFLIILARTRKGGIRRALFAGSVWLIVAMIGLGVAAVLGWEAFFAGFHSLFFADGTWTFYASDTLIRLYPNQFWIDAGITIAALTLITAIVTLVLTWPTRRRREDSRQDQIQLITRKNYWASESAR